MQFKKRFLLVLLSCAFLAFCYFGGYRLKHKQTKVLDEFSEDWIDLNHEKDIESSPYLRRLGGDVLPNNQKCRMETCFDFTKCIGDNFKVYIYPSNPDEEPNTISSLYQKVLDVVKESRYYTDDPSQACIFILAIDTLDRDPLSSNYVHNVPSKLLKLKHWNNGKNHIVFNLFSGTWPDYLEEDLGFDTGQAILAKASMSVTHFRTGFDVSIPLFQKDLPERGGEPGAVISNNFPLRKKYILAFKGKRYVYGIGSEVRNSLYHLHNGADMVLVTTCKHGKNWAENKDGRCSVDNAMYDRYDFQVLLHNSTFCLVPRGRRLGSFRFLETLQAGCIPVILSNGWVLPFDQVPDTVRSISATQVLAARQQTQVLWERYFSSIEKIVFTTFEIIRDRLPRQKTKTGLTWNWSPGALLVHSQFSDSTADYPFYASFEPNASEQFTAIIYAQLGTSLYKVIRNVAHSQYVSRIIVLWSSPDKPVPAFLSRHNATLPPIHILTHITDISHRFLHTSLVTTNAVLSLDEDATLNTDEIDFAFHVWKSFPERIVGYPARSHFWDDAKNSWGYTSKWTNDYSIVLTGAAFYHRYYNYLYSHWLSPLLLKTVAQSHNCEDILMNFLVSHVTRRPPIKVTGRKHYKETSGGGSRSPWNDPDHFIQRQTCLNTFAAVFGYMPLLRSHMRLDPVLYKDPVSNLRKKYRQMELVFS
ncbi:hypothetical protein M8J75_008522 [Diaphorina citri]|nr:hypothetical protein M8J75_008522 [Diaphorina citri]